MRKTIFYNSNPVAISSKMNEYMKSNFGYEVDGDLESLREAKAQLEAQKREMTSDYQDRAYVENMLMIETIKSLLKAHVAEGELPAGLKAYQDAKKKGKKKDDAKDTKEEKVNEAEKRWKQTSMSAAEAEKEYGKSNVKVKKGALRNGDDMVEVFVEGRMSDMIIDDSETLTKEEFAKKYGKEMANEYYESINEGKYKSDAQRKAVHAAKAEKATESEKPSYETNAKKYENSYAEPKEYTMKREKLEEGLLAQLNTLLESDAAEAEVMMAARGMVDELQDMIEKLGKLQNDQLGPLTDEMVYSHGADRAASFKDTVNDAVAGLLGQARATKDTVNDAVLVLNGETPADDMSSGDVIGDDMQDDFEDDVEVDFAAGDESASGPDDEPLGRAKRS